MANRLDITPERPDLAIVVEAWRYEEDLLRYWALFHHEAQRLTMALFGDGLTPKIRRELERRIEFYNAQEDRFEKKWDAHVRRMAEDPRELARVAEKKACAFSRPVLPSTYNNDVHQTTDVPSLLTSGSSPGEGARH